MDPFIKVCGIQTPYEAQSAVRAGANTIGLLLGLTHKAEDKLEDLSVAKRIAQSVPDHVRTTMVTHLLDPDETVRIAKEVGVKAIQIHDAMTPENVAKVREALPEVKLIKALHVSRDPEMSTEARADQAVELAAQYGDDVDMYLLDSRTKDRLGGTGLVTDWDASRQIVERLDKPVVLAGGLKPENIAEAIRTVGPAGIDANSGLETKDGAKDFGKMKAFATAGNDLLPVFGRLNPAPLVSPSAAPAIANNANAQPAPPKAVA